MRVLTLGVLALLAAAAPAAADAQSSSKLAIGAIRGDSSLVRRQILLQVCGPYQCVAASRYTTDDRPDPEKLAAGGIAGYLGGAVTGARGDRRVILTLTTPTSTAKKPARTWRLRLSPDGRLRPQVVERFAIEMDEILQANAAQVPPAPAAPPQRAPATRPPPSRAPPPEELTPEEPPPAPPPPREPPPAPPPPREPRPAAKPPPPQAEEQERPRSRERAASRPSSRPSGSPLRAAVEGGVWITSRKLSYSGASGGTLRTFDANAIFVPSLRLEAHAAAFGVQDRWLEGLGLYLDYGHSVGLKVKPPSGTSGGNRSATLSTLDVGAVWRVQPIAGSRLALAPALGYRSLQLVTGGAAIEGLPDAKLSGVELRLDVDAPVTPDIRILVGGGYTLWTQAKDLVKGGFFGKGSARGLELEGGLQCRVLGPLHVKGVLEYQSTSYSGLGNPAADIGTARGATDAYFGARVMARGEF